MGLVGGPRDRRLPVVTPAVSHPAGAEPCKALSVCEPGTRPHVPTCPMPVAVPRAPLCLEQKEPPGASATGPLTGTCHCPKCKAVLGRSVLLCIGLQTTKRQRKASAQALPHRRKRVSKAVSHLAAAQLDPPAHLHSRPAATQVPNFLATVTYLANETTRSCRALSHPPHALGGMKPPGRS